jgi:phage tail sheath gpL-like
VVGGSIHPSGYFFLKPPGRALGTLRLEMLARAMAARREAIEVNRRYLNGLADITSSLEVKPSVRSFQTNPGMRPFRGGDL